MTKNILILIIFWSLSINYLNAQFIDTVYFDLEGEIIIKEVASIYRVAQFNSKTGHIMNEFRDYQVNGDSLLAKGSVEYKDKVKIFDYQGKASHKEIAQKMCKLKASFIRINDYPQLKKFITPHKLMQEKMLYSSYDVNTNKMEEVEFMVVEQKPEFIGGMQTLSWFISQFIHYPEEALQNNISGVVKVKFLVDANGSIKDVTVIQSIGYGCDEEAVRVVQLLPDWLPGLQRGKPVKAEFVLPITFQ